jgi:N-acetylneuraminic acid mutarotase
VVTKEVPVTRIVVVTVTPAPTLANTPIPTLSSLPSPTPTLNYAGSWVSITSLPVPRSRHTATLLRDGRVLMVGGLLARDQDTARVDIFDPATNTFSATGSLHQARHDHTATLLPDGRVLVVGGYAGSWLRSAEIYDPATGQWTLTQPVFPHGVTHTATLLKDGSVLVVAGAIQSGSAGLDDRAEIFDPKTNQWQAAARHDGIDGGAAGTLLPDGRVLIVGGYADPAIYDPAKDIWQPAGKLMVPRVLPKAALLPDGRVLIVGGISYAGDAVLDSVEIYDPAANAWQITAPLSQARHSHAVTALPNGRVAVVGGWKSTHFDEDGLLNSVEIYDPQNETWTTAEALRTGRVNHTATLLPDGRVLVTGGEIGRGVALSSAESLGPSGLPSPTPSATYTGSWSSISPMKVPRSWHSATVLRDGRVLFAGGYSALDQDTATAEIFDPATNTFSFTGSLNAARHMHSATLLPDGRVLVIAGYALGWLSDAEIYDPATGQWTTTQPLYPHGVCHTATLLNDGRVLVMAGAKQSGSSGPDDRVEIFDPIANRWQAAARHENTEGCHTATRLRDGRVLIAGGNADPAIYDPIRNVWQPAGKLAVVRSEAQAALLPDGHVLLTGGIDPRRTTVYDSVEIYDPASNTWRLAASMAQPRFEHTATVLPDGRVLVVGGWKYIDGYEIALLNTAEIYDDKTGTWNTLAPLGFGHVRFTTTLLPDGRVLATGGETGRGTMLSSVEILKP